MSDTKVNQLLKKALFLETHERTAFLEQLEEGELKQKLTLLLNDDIELTQFVLKTSYGAQALGKHQIKDLKPGDKVKQFTIIKLIAKGGMGSVYLAYDEKLKRNVAIKTIRSEYIKNKATQQRFKQEAQILSQINHPSICQIYEYIDYDGGDMLVLELVDGITLSNMELSDHEKLEVFIQIASALEVAHKKDVIHRDLKPDNIMCDKNNKIKVLDFGIAKSTVVKSPKSVIREEEIKNIDKPLTKMGTLMGTLLYMSPEQAQGKEVTKASDIYSLGIIMQEILTGVAVYDLANAEDLKQQVIQAKKINIGFIPRVFQSLIASLTHRNPNKRLSAQELKQSLLEIKQAPQLKKRKLRNSMIALSVISLILILAYQWYDFNHQQNKTLFISSINNDASEIISTWKNIYTLPLHNIKNDVQNLLDVKEGIFLKIDSSDLLTIDEKKLLQGRVYWSNREYKKALPLLEGAWKSGIKTVKLARELALNNLMVYFLEAKKFVNENAYKDEKYFSKIENLYIKSAENYIKFLGGEFEEYSITNALMMWYKKDDQKAINILKHITENKNWDFEAFQIHGEIIATIGMNHLRKGNMETGNEYLQKAKKVYYQSSIRGRSFVTAYLRICDMSSAQLQKTVDVYGDKASAFFQETVKNCEFAVNINDNNRAINTLAVAYNRYGFSLIKRGENPLEYLNKSIKYSNEIDQSFRKYFMMAVSFTYKGLYKNNIGGNPLSDFDKAIKYNLKSISSANKKLDINFSNIMYIHLMKLWYEFNLGISPNDGIQEILNLNEKSIKSASSVVALNNSVVYRNSIIANAYLTKAQYLNLKDEDPVVVLDFIKDNFAKIKKVTDEDLIIDNVLVDTYNEIISYNLKHSKSSLNEFNHALSLINNCIEKTPSNDSVITSKAQLLINQQLIVKRDNKDSELNFDSPLELLKRANIINPNSDSTHTQISELYYLIAENSSSQEEIKKALNLGIIQSDTALTINPNFPFAFSSKAKLIKLGIDTGIFSQHRQQEVNELFLKANKLNPLLKIPK